MNNFNNRQDLIACRDPVEMNPRRCREHNDRLGMRHKLSLWFGVAGILLMPFSTFPDHFFVVSFGLPFIMIALLIGFDLIIRTIFEVKGALLYLLLIALLFSIVPILTSFISPTPGPSAYRAVVFLAGYFFAIWVLGMSRTSKSFQIIYHAFILSGIVLASYYIVNFLVKSGEFGIAKVMLDRISGGAASLPWGASNVIAGVILVPLIGCLAMGNFTKSRWFWFLPVVGTVAIALTFSRTVASLLLLSFILFGFKNFRREGFGATIVIGLLIICIVGSGMYLLAISDLDAFEYLMSSRMNLENITTGSGRLDIWADSLRSIPGTLFMPNGYYSSLYLYGLSSHNYFLTTALEQGILGLTASGAFFGALLLYFKTSRRIKVSYLWMWLIFVINISVEDLTFAQPYVFSFWLLFAISIVHRRSFYNEQPRPNLMPVSV